MFLLVAQEGRQRAQAEQRAEQVGVAANLQRATIEGTSAALVLMMLTFVR